MSERYRGKVRAPDFPAGLHWLNTDGPLTLAALRGKFVVLDFWTYCCVNCMHVLPQLKKLESRFPAEIVVIGVHSAKFTAEYETHNVRQAVMRYDIHHPVVNDRDFLLWRAYAIRAWPTLVVVDPEGMIVGVSAGEFDANRMGALLEQMIQAWEASKPLDRSLLHQALEKQKQPETLFSFPGKALADPDSDRLFVADTEHHRVVVVGLTDRRVRAVYGSGRQGLMDGKADTARLNGPQGMTLHHHGLYVADTGNHAIRRISLDSGVVTTFAGTGEQASPSPEEGEGRYARLNSPWDVLAEGEYLFIAMAGSHEIWRMHLLTGRLDRFAGETREALKDGPRRAARLAQPSGLASDGQDLWFVDSETSSLRSVPLEGEGDVRTWAGDGLFEFGDVDGDRKKARLQHPLGIVCYDGLVYVADTYNNKLRVLDPSTGILSTFSGNGEAGLEDGEAGTVSFWEPGGLTATEDRLYVADTNNHAIRVVDRATGEVMALQVKE